MENTGLAKELNFRSYYFEPYVGLAVLSLVTSLPPSIVKTLPIGILIIVLWWILSRSLGVSSVFSSLGALFVSLTVEIMPGLMEYSQFSIGFIFLLVFLVIQTKILKGSVREKFCKRIVGLIIIMLLVFAHFSYYSTEFAAMVWLFTIALTSSILKPFKMRPQTLFAMCSAVLMLNNPVVYDYVAFASIPTIQFLSEPRMGTQSLIIINALKVMFIGLLALTLGINSLKRNKKQFMIFIAFFIMILTEQILYLTSGQFNVLAITRNYWIFAPVLAFAQLHSMWKNSRHLKRNITVSCIVLLLILGTSGFFLRLTNENYFALPDIKYYQMFDPAATFLDRYTLDTRIFSSHDLAFLTLLRLDPKRSAQINTFGSTVWEIEVHANELYGKGSVLLMSSLHESFHPIQGDRNVNVRPPQPGLFDKFGKNPALGRIYDNGIAYLFCVMSSSEE
jgi:hypothetical protein